MSPISHDIWQGSLSNGPGPGMLRNGLAHDAMQHVATVYSFTIKGPGHKGLGLKPFLGPWALLKAAAHTPTHTCTYAHRCHQEDSTTCQGRPRGHQVRT